MSPDRTFLAESERRRVAGRYELGELIGCGSSAMVYRARDVERGIAVAVKQFHPGASAHDLRQQRQEMQALARLDHPGLVALHDGGTEDGRPFVVLDLVEGPTLAERIVAGPALAAGAVRAFGAQLADALAHVHAAGIVHRDVKPANVLLGADGRPRLADFGIARALDGTAATATGFVVGTAAYLAPEQVRGESVGPPTDVYALGLVLLEALTGRREYPGLAVESATARLHRAPAVPAGLPAGLGPLLAAMTGDEPERRPTAAAVAGVLRGRAVDPSHATLAVVTRQPRRRPRFSASLAAAAVLVAVLGGVMMLSPVTPASVAVEDAGPPPATPAEAQPPTPELVAVERPGGDGPASAPVNGTQDPVPAPAAPPVYAEPLTAGGQDDRGAPEKASGTQGGDPGRAQYRDAGKHRDPKGDTGAGSEKKRGPGKD